MSEHIGAWIDAYLDGELAERELRSVEAHLAGCLACREVVEKRRALAALLQSAPGVEARKSESRFTAEVALRLPRTTPVPAAPRREASLLQIGWHLAPVGLLLAMVFIQVVFILSGLTWIIPGAGELLQAGVVIPQGALPLAEPLGGLAAWIGGGSLLNWNWIGGLILFLLCGLVYLGWLASWWARSQKTY